MNQESNDQRQSHFVFFVFKRDDGGHRRGRGDRRSRIDGDCMFCNRVDHGGGEDHLGDCLDSYC